MRCALHRSVTLQSARAGKHVLCDKPTAPTFEELDAMLSACASSKVQFM
ncbi:gfo/Idh/MocA family oxidoreductase, partial [archaeon]